LKCVLGGGEGGEETGDVIGNALAPAGCLALSLGYFLEPGLPQCLCRIPASWPVALILWRASDGDDDLPPGVPLLQVPDGLGCFAQGIGPVYDRCDL
jgi:hypothetical protein